MNVQVEFLLNNKHYIDMTAMAALQMHGRPNTACVKGDVKHNA